MSGDQVGIDNVYQGQMGMNGVQNGYVQTGGMQPDGTQNGGVLSYLKDGRPVIGPGIERFTPKGRHKAFINILWMAVLFAGFLVLIAVIMLIFGGIRIRRAWFTMKDLPMLSIVMLILFLLFAFQDLVSLKPNRRYFYYDADKLAKAYGLSGVIMCKVKVKHNGEIKLKYSENRYAGKGLQPGLIDLKVKKNCLPISYTVIGEWVDQNDGKVKMCPCGLDFTSEGVSLRFDSLGSFPRRAKHSPMAQTALNELALKG